MEGSGVEAGEVVGGRYRLERHIGSGGMANVWQACDQTLDRPVAVKFLYAHDPEVRARLSTAFTREARIAAAVRHRYVVNILDFGTHGDQTPYMVMELLEGETLGSLIERRGSLPLPIVLDLVAHILEGLIAVHDAGIVHRDLKPENVFIVHERTRAIPKLLDFGISRSVDPQGGRRSALTTHDGQLLGTPHYMSPEQAAGEGDVDARADLYSLGVITYEALTGALPYDAEGVGALIVQIIQGEHPKVTAIKPELGDAVAEFVARAMVKDREGRFRDAVEMHAALIEVTERALGGDVAKAISVLPTPSAALSRSPTISDRARRPAEAPAGNQSTQVVHTEPVDAVADTFSASARDAKPPAQRSGRWPWVAALALALVGSGAALGLAYLPRQAPAETSAMELVRVSAAPDERVAAAADEPAEVAAPAATEPVAEAPSEPAAEQTAPAQAPAAAATPKKKRARERPEVALAGRFAKHKGRIAKCFDAAQEGEQPRLSLRMSLARSGKVLGTEVTPAGQASTPLGQCVQKVARAIEFGPQREAISFRVPLTVRRGR
ncbi:MAG: serine/threonine-protein kinase [Myxococcales bacterium]|nr:serine/threonine-protein kinase [Myxococcales bacterium]